MKVLLFPLARITLGFIPGIVVGSLLNLKSHTLTLLLTLTAALLFGCIFCHKTNLKRYYFGFLVYLLSFLVGICTYKLNIARDNPHNFSNKISFNKSEQILEVVLREKLKPTLSGDRYIAIVRRIGSKISEGKILLVFPASDSNLTVGSVLLLNVKINQLQKPLNPNSFDYSNYLVNKSIYGQAKVDRAILIGTIRDIWYYSDFVRRKMVNNLKKSGFATNELAVVSALILGQQQEISADVIHDYQFAGAIHILSVSGLHVGFILLFLNFILKWLPKNRKGAIIKLSITILILWGFAFIAGLSPSVVRSVTMFSFIAIGMYLRRSTNIFHTLLVSLLLILLWSPSFLFDVGFQLSYVALFFILWIQPWLASLWKPKFRIMEYFYSILTVSVAAQIGAFPLSVYYFHQFPALFFVTNLVIIPFLGIIMSLGVAVLISAGFGYVPNLPSKILEWCISSLNKIISYVASFEDFIFQDIPFNILMLWTSYIMIVFTMLWLINPGYKRMIYASVGMMAFIITIQLSRIEAERVDELIIFNASKHTLITERNGTKINVYNNLNSSQTKQILKPYTIANFCRSESAMHINNWMEFAGKEILIIDSSSVYPNKVAEVLLLRESPKINLERVLATTRPKIVIADASNYKTFIEKWDKTCAKEKIPFHYTYEKGSYKLLPETKL